MPTTKEFIERFTTLRQNAGLNKSQLANRLGVRVGFICQIESGESPIPAGRVSRLADALGVTEDEITLLRGDLPEDVKQAFAERVPVLINLIRALPVVVERHSAPHDARNEAFDRLIPISDEAFFRPLDRT